MEFAKLVEISELTIPSQNIIVNGVRQLLNEKVLCINCPSCGNVLYQYPREATKLEVWSHICNNKNDFMKVFKYCSICGQKLSFDSFDAVENKDE